MEKRLMCKGRVEVSALGFGVMRFPVKNGRIDRKLGQQMIDTAMKAGINYYDTAYVYHNEDSEVFLGEAMAKYPRQSYHIATKLPIWLTRNRRDAERLFAEQLKRLKTDYIDFYLMHDMSGEDRFRLVRDELVDFIKDMKAAGKIRFAGFSYHDVPDVLEKRLDLYDWDFVQLQVNYLDWDVQRAKESSDMLEKRGIDLVVMEPIRGGRLANPGPDVTELFKNVDSKASPASWALRWVAGSTPAKVVLSGMSTMEQLEENISVFSPLKPLTPSESEAVSRAAEILKGINVVPCTGCRYCVPCPVGVEIPENLAIYNEFLKGGGKAGLRWDYEKAFSSGGGAEECIACGECVEKCPQKIDIPARLSDMTAKLNG